MPKAPVQAERGPTRYELVMAAIDEVEYDVSSFATGMYSSARAVRSQRPNPKMSAG